MLGTTAESFVRLQVTIKHAHARGSAPHAAASTNGLAKGIARRFEQELARMVESVGREDITPMSFRGLAGSLFAGDDG
jgi:hypothetical protein